MSEITLEDVKRLRLQEGDTLVLRVGARLQEDMRETFPGHKTVVLGGDEMSLEVVEKPA